MKPGVPYPSGILLSHPQLHIFSRFCLIKDFIITGDEKKPKTLKAVPFKSNMGLGRTLLNLPVQVRGTFTFKFYEN